MRTHKDIFFMYYIGPTCMYVQNTDIYTGLQALHTLYMRMRACVLM